MFSRRLPELLHENALSAAVAARRARGERIIDLTASNPTTAGFHYPDTLLNALADPRALTYAPDPRGLAAARQAVAADAIRRGAQVDPSRVVLTASTSEAYSWLFKLLCDPGDTVLVPRPSYPLFEHLTSLEAVRTAPYDLEYHGRWTIDFDGLEQAPASTRAVLVVTPNNPTGSYISTPEIERLASLCRHRRWALIADEVFADYALDEGDPATDLASRLKGLTFTLGGASKSLGLPQVKLGWIVVGGEGAATDEALTRLELIADTFLSVNIPVQVAAPALLQHAAPVRTAIHDRVRTNLRQARDIAQRHPACEVLGVGGGWSAVIRVPAVRSEEQLVLDLLEQTGVLVHPGFFFDFRHEAFVVVSLLPPEAEFAEATERLCQFAASM
jgi:aspartate/methionine/tyrosine aminotransferase